MKTDKIYEVVDYSDDERYYPLAVFLSLEEAIERITNAAEHDGNVSPYSEDFEKIVVRERAVGWSENGKEVFTLSRVKEYDEDGDDYNWKPITEE